MKFLKNLLTFLFIIAVLGALGFGFWHFYGDALMESLENTEETVDQSEYLAMVAETKELRDLLTQAYTHMENAQVLECRIQTVYDKNGRQMEGNYKNAETTHDRVQGLKRMVDPSGYWTETFILGQYIELSDDIWSTEQWYSWTPIEYQQDLAVCHSPDSGDQVWYTALPDTWYYSYCDQSFNTEVLNGQVYGLFPTELPHQLEVVDYEIVGVEKIDGKQATHYIVTHWPLMRYGNDIGRQYWWSQDGNVSTPCGPEEYFPWAIDAEVQQAYPEYYQQFMELVDRHYYENSQSHLWITDDGYLLKAQIDCTLEIYTARMVYLDTEDVQWYEENQDTVDPDSYDAMFFTLSPITRTICYYYDADAEPIVLPEDVISIPDGEHPEQN